MCWQEEKERISERDSGKYGASKRNKRSTKRASEREKEPSVFYGGHLHLLFSLLLFTAGRILNSKYSISGAWA